MGLHKTRNFFFPIFWHLRTLGENGVCYTTLSSCYNRVVWEVPLLRQLLKVGRFCAITLGKTSVYIYIDNQCIRYTKGYCTKTSDLCRLWDPSWKWKNMIGWRETYLFLMGTRKKITVLLKNNCIIEKYPYFGKYRNFIFSV